MPMKANYYEILGVEKTASREAIKAAFREKARKHHPDVNNNSLESTVRASSRKYSVSATVRRTCRKEL